MRASRSSVADQDQQPFPDAGPGTRRPRLRRESRSAGRTGRCRSGAAQVAARSLHGWRVARRARRSSAGGEAAKPVHRPCRSSSCAWPRAAGEIRNAAAISAADNSDAHARMITRQLGIGHRKPAGRSRSPNLRHRRRIAGNQEKSDQKEDEPEPQIPLARPRRPALGAAKRRIALGLDASVITNRKNPRECLTSRLTMTARPAYPAARERLRHAGRHRIAERHSVRWHAPPGRRMPAPRSRRRQIRSLRAEAAGRLEALGQQPHQLDIVAAAAARRTRRAEAAGSCATRRSDGSRGEGEERRRAVGVRQAIQRRHGECVAVE